MNKRLCVAVLLVLTSPVALSVDKAVENVRANKGLLSEEILKGEPEALAEWAYNSVYSLRGVAYNPQKIFTYAKSASDKGSGLGSLLLAKCYIDGVGTKADSKGAKTALSLAWKSDSKAVRDLMGAELFYAKVENPMYGTLVNRMELHAESTATFTDGNWGEDQKFTYPEARAFCLQNGVHGMIDFEESYKLYMLSLKESNSLRSAMEVFRSSTMREDGLSNFIQKEDFDLACARLEVAAGLGHPEALLAIAEYEIEWGNPYVGLPLLGKSLNTGGSRRASLTAFRAMLTGIMHQKHKTQFSFGGGDYYTRLVAHLYNTGCRNTGSTHAYTYQVSRRYSRSGNDPKVFEELLDVYRNIIKAAPEDYTASVYLSGRLRRQAIKQTKVGDYERGLMHAIYATINVGGALSLPDFYLELPDHLKDKYYDPVKAVAAAHWYFEFNETRTPLFKEMKDRMKPIEAGFTEKQRQRLSQLKESGFPASDQYRRAAFVALQKYGDYPKEWDFLEQGEVVSKDNGRGQSWGKPLKFSKDDLKWNLPQKNDGEVTYKPEEIEVLRKVEKGEDLLETDLQRWCELTMKDPHYLRGLLGKHLSKSSPELYEEWLKKLGRVRSDIDLRPFGIMGKWYLLHDGNSTKIYPVVFGASFPISDLERSDMIEFCYGVPTEGADSPNRFLQMLQLWPEGYALKFSVRRSAYEKQGNRPTPKNVKVEIEIPWEVLKKRQR